MADRGVGEAGVDAIAGAAGCNCARASTSVAPAEAIKPAVNAKTRRMIVSPLPEPA